MSIPNYPEDGSHFQAFDQQQQDLVDAASKALLYRQDIIVENTRLTYALQVFFCYWNIHAYMLVLNVYHLPDVPCLHPQVEIISNCDNLDTHSHFKFSSFICIL